MVNPPIGHRIQTLIPWVCGILKNRGRWTWASCWHRFCGSAARSWYTRVRSDPQWRASLWMGTDSDPSQFFLRTASIDRPYLLCLRDTYTHAQHGSEGCRYKWNRNNSFGSTVLTEVGPQSFVSCRRLFAWIVPFRHGFLHTETAIRDVFSVAFIVRHMIFVADGFAQFFTACVAAVAIFFFIKASCYNRISVWCTLTGYTR